MEYPDKEEEPYRHIVARVKEIKKARIPLNEKELICALGNVACEITESVERFYIENTHDYVIDALDRVCDLVLRQKDYRDKLPVITDIINDSKAVLNAIDEIENSVCFLIEGKEDLERRVISQDVIAEMKRKHS